MASTICRSSATRTLASTSLSTSTSTSTSLFTTTIPGSVVTSLIRVCPTAANATVCQTSTSIISQPGSTVVSTRTVVVTVTVPYVNQVTLWDTSCSTIPANSPYSPPSPPTITTTTTTPVYIPPTSTTPVHIPPTSTTPPPPPPPSTTIYSTSSVVTEDSTTYVTYFTTTAVSEPSSSPPPPPSPLAETSAPNTAAIVGGAIGGLALLALLAFLVFIMAGRSNKFSNLFRRSNNSDQFVSSGKEPYQYGPVSTQPMGFSPPSSPERQPAALTDMRPFSEFGGAGIAGPSGTETGMQYGGTGNNMMFNAPNQASIHHLRNPSLTPLLAGGAVAAAAAGTRLQRPDTMSSSGRVSTASSDLVGPMVTHASPQQNVYYPPTAYPAGLASYAQQHGFIPPDEQQQQQNLGHNRNGSVGSHTTMTSIPGNVGGNYPPFGAAGISRPGQYPQQQYMQNMQQRYEDPFTRVGSPESIPEASIVSQMQSTDHTTDISSTSSRPFNTPGLRLVGGSSMSSMDGKGRPLRNPKAPMVHLDGGEYLEAPPVQSSGGVPQPPAYDAA